ncbi:carbohydrate esterase family 9 protein [Earliella scabrosa]|nr:carbohydrate esterase family 9 protein [Earliella scabrosa]
MNYDKRLPVSTFPGETPTARPQGSRRLRAFLSLVLLLTTFQFSRLVLSVLKGVSEAATSVPIHATEILEKCRLLQVPPGPPPDFHARTKSDRFVPGTKPTLITNATIWTGGQDGLEVVHGDILLDRGIIQQIYSLDGSSRDRYDNYYTESVTRIDAQGKWVSPGIVDLHSHLGLYPVPILRGTLEANSMKGPVLPWLRALDGLNTHDAAFQLSASGGVTTALVLPGSSNAMGGQGVVIKLRHTDERSPTSMLLENPWETNTTVYDPKTHFRYRQMKHACGENPGQFYANTRMDTVWAFREGYEKARQIKEAQDDYCAKATRGDWSGLGDYPEDLHWEALVDVLRGRVKVHTHCYETVDLDDLVRITNEFKFSIAAIHHAHEAYLVPDTLKAAYGRPPAAALFATVGGYKREAFRGSEFAPRILAENGLRVIMKSDHPVLDSRFLLWEAQQAYYYGLPYNLALASVTSTPASVLGQDHRIGYVKEGYDADLVLWDSHPLALGATPQQVWIDAIPQLATPHTLSKSDSFQSLPKVPNFDAEAKEALEYDGLPPLEPQPSVTHTVIFANVSSALVRTDSAGSVGVEELAPSDGSRTGKMWAVVEGGRLVCADAPSSECVHSALRQHSADVEVIDLQGGSITPGLTTFGSPLGLEEISGEISTRDGTAPDGLTSSVPSLAGGGSALIRASDGLQFGTRHALLAYRSGITAAVVAPTSDGLLAGLSTAFATGALHKLQDGAIIQEAGTVHVSVHPGGTQSVSTQIAALRRLLLSQTDGELGRAFEQIRKGAAPLVIDVDSADIMATLIALKSEAERVLGVSVPLNLTFSGGGEAHLLAKEIGQAGIGVILTQPRPFPKMWDAHKILPGPPLSAKSQIVALLRHNVTVGVGTQNAVMARNTRFDTAWAALDADGLISKEQAVALASTNVEKLLGIERKADEVELVATRGGDLLGYGKVAAVISPVRGVVDLL